MPRSHSCFLIFSLTASICYAPAIVSGQGSWQDYQRSANYAKRTSGLVARERVEPVWFGEDQGQFWYKCQTGKRSHEFVLVDAKSKARQPAFDHVAIAERLSIETKTDVSPTQINLAELAFTKDLSVCRFRFQKSNWELNRATSALKRVERGDAKSSTEGIPPSKRVVRSRGGDERVPLRFDNRIDEPLEIMWMPASGRPVSYGTVGPGKIHTMSSFVGHAFLLKTNTGKPRAAFVVNAWSDLAIIDADTPEPKPVESRRQRPRRPNGSQSPNGLFRVRIEDHNVKLINTKSDDEIVATTDGNERDFYGGNIWWSPDSRHFVVLKTKPGEHRQVSIIESAPKDSIHSKVITMGYAKPGDRLDHPRPVLFSVDGSKPQLINDSLFPNPFHLRELNWNESGDTFRFLYNQRGHQALRLVGVNAETAEPRTIAEETPETFVCYSSKSYMHYVGDEELIWMSERSGWNHLYLIDQKNGQVKNAITSGDWVVRSVERVDNEQRRIWLTVSGIDKGQDPYHKHLIRVDFDGKHLVRLTEGDGDHTWRFSPGNEYLIDTFSRVDMPPVTNLRDAESGELVCELETADAKALYALPWKAPERFVAKGRDGNTDIHGIIIRPTNFDPKKKYPVLEAIYAGPHSAFVPKRFSTHSSLYSMAELGFIIVKIDGMGTNHRSKAFHDVCWQNIGDSGFPDRVAWIKAAAKDRPEMDLSRVGIWGGSAGGQSAMRALITHGDFYHAAVADCGCHDNRVDKIWWNEQWMGYPIGPHYAEQSNVTQAKHVKGDLMLIWGELDQNVDPASTMQVIDALVKADVDFQQLIVPGAGHGAAGRPYAKRRQADFFVRKLWHREPRHRRDTGTKDLFVAKTPTRDLLLDLYLPENKADAPLVVFIHGGGWQNGSYKSCSMSWLTEHGYAVASIGYRLTDEATFPAQIHDCKAAVRWLRANAERYGYNATKIAVAGTSAGGHLAALMGTSGGVSKLEGDLGFDLDQSSRVQAVIDFYGATDFVLRSKTQPHRANEPGSVVYKLLGGGADQKIELAKLAGASTHVSKDDPPMLVLHGAKDKTVLLDQSEKITKVYKEHGLDIEFRVLPDAGHGGKQFMQGEHREAIIEFLNRHL